VTPKPSRLLINIRAVGQNGCLQTIRVAAMNATRGHSGYTIHRCKTLPANLASGDPAQDPAQEAAAGLEHENASCCKADIFRLASNFPGSTPYYFKPILFP
jgi:hypothetical protein